MSDVSMVAIDLTEKRLRLGLSIRQAAMAIGVDWNTLRAAEAGKRPSPAVQVKIADYYKVDQLAQWPIEPAKDAA